MNLEERTKEITQIASSISELADLFRDLGNLVVEQGTVLDSVEYNVQTTARELKGAVEELKIAQRCVRDSSSLSFADSRYQANTGRRKCILFLVLCIVGLIIVLIYKPRSHPSDDPIPSDNMPDFAITSQMSSSRHRVGGPSTRTRPSLGKPSSLPAIPIGDDGTFIL